ncbi:BlaI/MecI/CopY family transcriptional regulator [Amycolatopsis sp. NPDC004378]
MAGHRKTPGSLEQDVLRALAAAGRPLTPSDVRAEMDADLAYTTVMTVLARLHEKGALTRQRDGRAYAYQLADPTAVTAHRMRQLLDSEGDRAGVLTRFMGELTDEDEQLLASLLHRAERQDER